MIVLFAVRGGPDLRERRRLSRCRAQEASGAVGGELGSRGAGGELGGDEPGQVRGQGHAAVSHHHVEAARAGEAADDGLACYPLFERDPNLDRIRRDPGFVAFLAEQKNRWEAFSRL